MVTEMQEAAANLIHFIATYPEPFIVAALLFCAYRFVWFCHEVGWARTGDDTLGRGIHKAFAKSALARHTPGPLGDRLRDPRTKDQRNLDDAFIGIVATYHREN